MNVAVIPARGGSKGIVHKNVIDLHGRPLVAWSIGHALNARCVDRVVVSTDDDEIADVSRQWGAEVITRPDALAADNSQSEGAILHAIDTVEAAGDRIDLTVFLQATSPIRRADDIDNAVDMFLAQKADSLFPATRIEDYFMWETGPDRPRSVNYDYRNRQRSQKIDPGYRENGSIYVFRPELIRQEKNRLGGKIVIYEMPNWTSYQIDQLDDLGVCDYFLGVQEKTEASRNAR